MLNAYDVMTHTLATCAPDANLAHVTAIMRDRDIGNVLVVEDGKLLGIVTDRDLALQALTGRDDPFRLLSDRIVLRFYFERRLYIHQLMHCAVIILL